MKDYSRKDDWSLIVKVKQELTRLWIRVEHLKISCTRGHVDIQGPLEFSGQAKSTMDSVTAVASGLRKLDAALMAINNVRAVKWKLLGWEKKGKHWTYQPTAEIRKKDEKKGFKL